MPVFGICYGFQAMAQALGGTVAHTGLREYGATDGARSPTPRSTLFDGQPDEQSVWMRHGDSRQRGPRRLRRHRLHRRAPVAAFEDDERRLYGVQWHPEVDALDHGQQVLENFLYEAPASTADLDHRPTSSRSRSSAIREQVGDGRVHLRACPAASTRRWPPPWCSGPSATS